MKIIVGKDNVTREFKGKVVDIFNNHGKVFADGAVVVNDIPMLYTKDNETIFDVAFYYHMFTTSHIMGRNYADGRCLILDDGTGYLAINDVVYIPTVQEYVTDKIFKTEHRYNLEAQICLLEKSGGGGTVCRKS